MKVKIKWKYLQEIYNDDKKMEFRKVNFLNKIDDRTSDSFIWDNSRIVLRLWDTKGEKYYGLLYIDGYKIKPNNEKTMWLLAQYEWASRNLDFIKEYYKDEKEILALSIEKLELEPVVENFISCEYDCHCGNCYKISEEYYVECCQDKECVEFHNE